jgi:hypothetical protein
MASLNFVDFKKWVLIALGLFFPIVAEITSLNDCQTDRSKWETYTSAEMQVTFSYPLSWKIIPERPDESNIAGMELKLQAKDIILSIHRIYDKDESKNLFQNRFEKAMAFKGFHNRNIVFGKNSSELGTEISIEKDNFRKIFVYCIQKGFWLAIEYSNCYPNQECACTKIIDQMLSSFVINGKASSSLGGCSSVVKKEYLQKLKDRSLDNHPDSGESLRSEALFNFCSTCGTNDSVVVNELARLLKNDEYPSVRSAAAELIGNLDKTSSIGDLVLSALKSGIHDSDFNVRLKAATVLLKLKQSDTSEILDAAIAIAKNNHIEASIHER